MTDEKKQREKEHRNAYYLANRETISEKNKAYREANKDKLRERWRAYNKKNRERINAYQRAYHHKNSEKARDKSLKRLYGISLEVYEAFLWVQKGACAICGRKQTSRRRLSVDHDHETGEVRGLLCDQCNLGLGSFGDDVKTLTSAINYIKARKESSNA